MSRKESTDQGVGGGHMSLSQPHTRRLSRMDTGFHLNHASRRMSMFPGGRRQSIASYRSGTEQSSVSLRKPAKLENTYRLTPHPDAKFNCSRVEKALRSILESFLAAEEYQADKCSKMAQNLTEVIKERIKDMGFTRYKLVCNVVIGQQANQGMQGASRCLWNPDFDTYATASYKNTSLFAMATVYGLYFE